MTFGLESLRSLATIYAGPMTSIRGRRVVRLILREFAGADVVAVVSTSVRGSAVLGASAVGAAFCATDGTGRQATVFKWVHGSTSGQACHFSLHKDSLPELDREPFSLSALRAFGNPTLVPPPPVGSPAKLLAAALHAFT